MADKRVEEFCYWFRPKSAALGSAKTSFTLHSFARFVPANLHPHAAWHLWHCTKHDEVTSEQSTCPDWEEE